MSELVIDRDFYELVWEMTYEDSIENRIETVWLDWYYVNFDNHNLTS